MSCILLFRPAQFIHYICTLELYELLVVVTVVRNYPMYKGKENRIAPMEDGMVLNCAECMIMAKRLRKDKPFLIIIDYIF